VIREQEIGRQRTAQATMDLGAWNTEFDSSLLNCWNDNAETNSRGSSDPKDKKKNDSKLSQSSPRDDSSSWDGNLNQWIRLPSFSVDYEADTSEKAKSPLIDSRTTHENRPSSTEGCKTSQINSDPPQPSAATNVASTTNSAISNAQPAPPAPVSETTSVTSPTRDASSVNGLSDTSNPVQQPSATSSTSSTGGNGNSQNAPQLHPLAIQSSATCPPHSNSNTNSKSNQPQFGQIPMPPNNAVPQQRSQQQQSQNPSQNLYGLNLGHALDTSSVASLAASLQQTTSHAAPSSAATTSQHLSSLTANFILAKANSNGGTAAAGLTGQAQTHSQNLHATVVQGHSQRSQQRSAPSAPMPSISSNSVAQARLSANSGASFASSSQPSHLQPQQAQSNLPPFYLFDAPIELRANFMQNQRKLGIPIQHDCNSFHYGETVNGFHPQQLLSQQQQRGLGQPRSGQVKLIDARHGTTRPKGAGRVKNEREQKRAQKITELIEQLRVNMENGGWKVELRSKFHTLSSCAEYVKHMIKTMKEKEETVNQLKSDLEVKKRKIEEEKALQESRSDPESVTSSLTSGTTASGQACHQKRENDKKRKTDSADSSGKKHRVSSQNTSSISTQEDSSGGEERGSNGPSAQSFSVDKTVSSVSDITDSNRGSSCNNSGSGSGSEVATERVSPAAGNETDENQPSSSSVSSDAAVASEKSSLDRHSGGHHNHKDVVFNTEKRSDRKRPPEEITSLDRSFELDYEEVFDKSNIPQLIATTSGKVVTWNECFIKATGLRKSEVERMTIFSFVEPDKLSNFFEIVAAALKPEVGEEGRKDGEQRSKSKETEDKSSGEDHETGADGIDGSSERQWNYAAMTLPCIEFPAMKKRRKAGDPSYHNDPLHVTVTLMTDKEPRKRCFHCVFTNCAGTNGALGSLTPELLASLFAAPETSSKKSKARHDHDKTKRARTEKDHPSSEEQVAPLQKEEINSEIQQSSTQENKES